MCEIRNYSLPHDMFTQQSNTHHRPSLNLFDRRYDSHYDRQHNYHPTAHTHFHSCNEDDYPSGRSEARFDPYRRFDRQPDYFRPPSRHTDLSRDWDCHQAHPSHDRHADTRFPDYADKNDDPHRMEKDFDEARIDDYMTDFPPRPLLSEAVEALKNLSDAGIEKHSAFDMGFSANDVRSGKYGALTPAAAKELAKLSKDEDYRLVQDNTHFSHSNLWVPIKGGTPIVITHSEANSRPGGDKSPLLDFLKITNDMHAPIGYGISANKLRSGNTDRLPSAVRESLEKLNPNSEYDLVCFPDKRKDDGGMMTWVERGTGAKVEVGFDDETPIS